MLGGVNRVISRNDSQVFHIGERKPAWPMPASPTPETPHEPATPPTPEADFEAWEAAEDAIGTQEALVVSLDGFEGPLDVLLALARTQKVDLAKISVLALADQYLLFIAEARKLRLELAADYLVMAAWLAYLKSQAAAAARGRRRGPADRRGAGRAPGVPAEAAGGHAQRRGRA